MSILRFYLDGITRHLVVDVLLQLCSHPFPVSDLRLIVTILVDSPCVG